MTFLPPNQQHQSTEGASTKKAVKNYNLKEQKYFLKLIICNKK